MRIIRAEIDWAENWDNAPNLKVWVDKLPEWESLQFETHELHGGTMCWANDGAYVAFFTHSRNNESGYGGRVFTITDKAGDTRSFKGPWSDNARSMNGIFTACCEVVYYETEGRYNNVGLAGAMLATEYYRLVKELGADCVWVAHYGGNDVTNQLAPERQVELFNRIANDQVVGHFALQIVRKGLSFAQSQALKRRARMVAMLKKENDAKYRANYMAEIARLTSEFNLPEVQL